MDIRSFSNGEILFHQGDHGDCMYVIHSGTIGVFREYGTEYESRIAELGPGAVIGEMDLIDKGRRSATCVVLSEEARLERVTNENYMDYFEKNPLQVYLIMKQLTGRLRETTENYTDACRAVYELLRNAETGEEPSSWLQENQRRFSSVYMNRGRIRPVKETTDTSNRLDAAEPPAEQRSAEEILIRELTEQMEGPMDRMDDQVRQYIARLTHITAEKERIAAELSLAGRIQESMLPHTFPDRREFALYAGMDPAKEVGGDFYDCFLIDEDHLCMMIADVSGKGIPAALFMMSAKSILFSNAMMSSSPAQILEKTNETICGNNNEEMFVSVWIAVLEISAGRLRAANAGHEFPVLKKPNGSFELVKDKHGLVIGGMKGIKYREYELQLEPGSKIFVYTDGVPEASDAHQNMFTINRMLHALNKYKDSSPQEILDGVRNDINEFVGDAPQFDDLTMLCLEIK